VSTNNCAATGLELFLESIHKFGCPSWVHGDRGGENIDVAVCMIMHKGAGRSSFLWESKCIYMFLFLYTSELNT
jgi:hypothetical protein